MLEKMIAILKSDNFTTCTIGQSTEDFKSLKDLVRYNGKDLLSFYSSFEAEFK